MQTEMGKTKKCLHFYNTLSHLKTERKKTSKWSHFQISIQQLIYRQNCAKLQNGRTLNLNKILIFKKFGVIFTGWPAERLLAPPGPFTSVRKWCIFDLVRLLFADPLLLESEFHGIPHSKSRHH